MRPRPSSRRVSVALSLRKAEESIIAVRIASRRIASHRAHRAQTDVASDIHVVCAGRTCQYQGNRVIGNFLF